MVYSREGRYYVFYYFCLLLFWLALNRHYNQPTRKTATLAALAGAMSPLTTPYGFLPVCIIMVVYAVLALQDRHYSYIRRLPLLGIAFVIFALPAFAWAIRYAQYVLAGFSSKPPDYERLMHLSDIGNLKVWTALTWQAFFQVDIWGEYHKVDTGPQQIAWFLAFLCCCLSCATHKSRAIRTLPLLALFNIAILIAVGSDTQGPHIRYFVGAWLPIHLITSIGFGTVLLRIGTRVRLESKPFLIASAITIGALCVWSYNTVVKDAKYAYGEVTRLVLGVQAKNDAHMVFVAGDENSGIPRHLVNTHLKLTKGKIATTELDRKNMLSSADAAKTLAKVCRLTSATLFYSTHNPSSVWQDLETSGLAVGIQMYDERTLYATSLSLLTGMQEPATFRSEILQNALDLLCDNPYSKAVISYQVWKVARRNPGLLAPEELTSLEQDFMKANPSYAAQVYQHRGDYNGVTREASKLIRQRPHYFYGYVLYAHGKQMQFEVTKDTTSLKEALREFQKGVDKGVKFESWIEKWITDLKVKVGQPIAD